MGTRLFSGRRSDSRSLVIRAVSLGFAAGLRSQVPNAALARRHGEAPRPAGWRHWLPFRWPAARNIMQVGAVGEMIGDKSPMTPSRLAPAPLGGRIAFGALAGAAIGSEYRSGSAIAAGAVLGGAGAVAGSFGGYRARSYLTSRYQIPDLPVALAEDVLAVGIARRAVR